MRFEARRRLPCEKEELEKVKLLIKKTLSIVWKCKKKSRRRRLKIYLYSWYSFLEARKWLNVKVVNQVGTRVKIKANKILPSAVLSSGEIFVYHQLLNQTDRKATITLKAVDEYTDKPLIINGDQKFYVTPTTYDDTQEAYVSREGEWSDKMKIIFERHCVTFPRDIVIWCVMLHARLE